MTMRTAPLRTLSGRESRIETDSGNHAIFQEGVAIRQRSFRMSSGELSFESPPFLQVTWNIPDFFKLTAQTKYFLQSPDFTFAGDRYFLQLFKFQGYGWDCIRIELLNFIDRDIAGDVWYEVQVKSTANEIDISAHLQNVKDVHHLSRSDLHRQRDLYVPDGTLTVLCSVRLTKPSSAGSPKSRGAQTQIFPKYKMIGTLFFELFPLLYVTWRIPRFFHLAPNFIYSLESPEFPFSDRRYCLQLSSSEDGFEIRLVNLPNTDPGRYISYEVGLKSTSGKEIYTQRCRKGKFHISQKALYKEESECFSDGHLTVFCSVVSREPNSAGSPNSSGAETNVFLGLNVPVPQADTHPKSSGTEIQVIPRLEAPVLQVAAHPNSSGTETQVFPDSKCPVPQAATHTKSGGAETSNEEGDKEVLPGISKLLSDYRKLLKKVPGSDACLVVSGKEFRAHQIILRARSTVFGAMFGHETAESESGRVVIDDLDPDSFGDFLEYLYTGVVAAGLSDDNAFGLYKAADKYDLPTLKAECVAHMRRSLSVDSFCDVLALALRHREEELLSQAVTFFKENMARIIVTVKWQQFVIDNATSANELFIKAIVPPGQ